MTLAISIQSRPMLTEDIKAIQDWLRLPGCATFQRYIADLAASHAAKAGALLVRDDDADDKEKSELAVKLSKTFVDVNATIDTIRAPDYTWDANDLKPATINPPLPPPTNETRIRRAEGNP